MTCYARPLAFLFLILMAALAGIGMFGPLIAVAAGIVTSLTGAVLAVMIIARTQRRRAAAGSCTACRHQCQGELSRAVEESFVSARRPGQRPAVFLDEPAIRWPDRPGTRSRTGVSA